MATNSDPGGWAAIAAGYQQAGYTQDSQGNWHPPATTNQQAPSSATGGGDPIVALSEVPANIQSDPNKNTDTLSQQEAYAMQQYASNPAVAQAIAQLYPDLAWMTQGDIGKELTPILASAVVNGWGQGQIDAALSTTTWWKQNGSTARNFYQQQQQDPASAAQAVAQNAAQLQQYAADWGVPLTPDQLNSLATQATAYQWNPAQMEANVKAAYNVNTESTNQGAIANIQQVVQQVAGDYLMPADPNTIKFWTNAALQNGGNDPATAAANLRSSMSNFYGQTAAQRFPWMKTAIASGMTPKDYLAPYTAQAAKTLAISPDSINWADPKWQGALLQTDNTGTQVPKNSDQFNKALMQDPTFGYSKTQGAIDQAYGMAQTIATTFGKVK